MAKKVNNKPAPVEWVGFVSCDMNAERRIQFAEWEPNLDDLSALLHECISPGYKVSFSEDTYHNCIQASWYCGARGDKNAGMCLTARGRTVDKALAVLVFKHTVILEGDWTSAPPLDIGEDQIW